MKIITNLRTVIIVLIISSSNLVLGQNDTMIRVKFNDTTTAILQSSSPNTFSIIPALNTLLNNYNVSFFEATYSTNVLDPSLKKYYSILFEGTTDNFISDLAALSITDSIGIRPPDSIVCSNPVAINDQRLVLGWSNNDAILLADAQCAWTITKGDPSIRVAIADTDFDENHEDLNGQIREVYGPVTAGEEHGTHVLGVAGAKPNNIGIIGAGYNLKWDGARVPHNQAGSGYPEVGITNAANKNARVINVSWSGTGYDRAAMLDLVSRGITVVVEAGNQPNSNSHSEISDIPGVIMVSGVNKDGYHGPTNHARNSRVELCAMSYGVTALNPNNNYTSTWGTSMAAPQVTATAGLILSLNPCFTPAQIEHIITSTTKPIQDASTYSGLVGTGYLDMYNALKYAAGRTGTVAANETWTKQEIVSGKLIVPSGITLTIKSKVLFYTEGGLIIKPGGKVIIDGGILTSICPNWSGIRVEGVSTLNQTGNNQGKLELKNNAIIEHARNAVSLSGLNSAGNIDYNKLGGIIISTGSTFRNNNRDVEFLSYHNRTTSGTEVNNVSIFKTTSFLTDNNNRFSSNGAHVTIWDVNGVSFQGCTFQDTRTSGGPKKTGIYTINANFTVINFCTTPLQIPCTSNPSKFINLKNGIQSFGNGTRGTITIENTQFTVYKGIFLQGTNNSSIRSNTFNIAHDPIVAGNTNYPFGLYLDKCQGFNTEGNQFTGTTGTANVSNGGAAGLVVRNTGANNNTFYRSSFDNLKIASQALSENREKYIVNGLRFRCNDYEQSYNDLDVRNDPNNPAANPDFLGMAELQGQIQGSGPVVPDNNFGNSSNILNLNIENRANWMQYVHRGSPIAANRLWPSSTSPISLFQYNTGTAYCPDLLGPWGQFREPLNTKLGNLAPVIVLKRSQIRNSIDGGNTQGLISDIVNATPGTVAGVVSGLLTKSPHLSNDVLATLAEQNFPFTNENIRDVLAANPHASRSLWVQTTLDARSNPLAQSYRNDINQNVHVLTQRDIDGAEYAYLCEEYDWTLNELLFSYLTDPSYTLSEVATFLKHPVNPTYHYQLAEFYFDSK